MDPLEHQRTAKERTIRRLDLMRAAAGRIAAKELAPDATAPMSWHQGQTYEFEITKIRLDYSVAGEETPHALESPAMVVRRAGEARAYLLALASEPPAGAKLGTPHNLLRPEEPVALTYTDGFAAVLPAWQEARRLPDSERSRYSAQATRFPRRQQLEATLAAFTLEEKDGRGVPLEQWSVLPASRLLTSTSRLPSDEGGEYEEVVTHDWETVLLQCRYDAQSDSFTLSEINNTGATAFAAAPCVVSGADLTAGWSGDFVAEKFNADGSSYRISPPHNKPPGGRMSLALNFSSAAQDYYGKNVASEVVIASDDLTEAIRVRAKIVGKSARTREASPQASAAAQQRNSRTSAQETAVLAEAKRDLTAARSVQQQRYEAAQTADLDVKVRNDYGAEWLETQAKVSWSPQDPGNLLVAPPASCGINAISVAVDDLLAAIKQAAHGDPVTVDSHAGAKRTYRLRARQQLGETGKPNFMQIVIAEKEISFDLYEMAQIAGRAFYGRRNLPGANSAPEGHRALG